MFLTIQIDLIILKTHDQQFTLTTKKSLHIIFKDHFPSKPGLASLSLVFFLQPFAKENFQQKVAHVL